MPLRVLVTGASGFVGGHIALGLAENSLHVIASGGLHECPLEVRCAAEQTLSFNLQSQESILKLFEDARPDAIVHAAALANPSACEKNPEEARLVNVEGMKNLLAVFKSLPSKPLFIYISTDLVFDGGCAPEGGFHEEDEARPISVYGKSKLEAERILLNEYEKAFVARICLVYGNELGGRQGFLTWILGALKESKPLTLFVDEFRTPIYASDVNGSIIEILSRYERNETSLSLLLNYSKPHARVFHVPGSERISRYDFAKKLIKITGHPEKLLVPRSLKDVSLANPRSPDVSLCGEKIRHILGIRTLDVNEGLQKLTPLLKA